jgi:hypothetical protein
MSRKKISHRKLNHRRSAGKKEQQESNLKRVSHNKPTPKNQPPKKKKWKWISYHFLTKI